MKHVNFVDTKQLQNYQDSAKWLRKTLLLIAAIVIALKFFSLTQWNKLRAIRDEIQEQISGLKTIDALNAEHLQAILQKQTKLKKQKKELNNKLETIQQLSAVPKKEFALLLDIHKQIPQNTHIQKLSITKEQLILLLKSPHEKAATYIVEQLSKLPSIKSIKLTSLQTMQAKDNAFVFEIKGEIRQ